MNVYFMPKLDLPFSCLKDREFTYSETNLSRKMFMLADLLCITMQEKREIKKIVSDLIHILRPYYPECDVIVFGSYASGFGLRGCDLDLLFLPFPDYCNIYCKDVQGDRFFVPADVLNGDVPKDKLYNMNEEMHLDVVQSIMRRYVGRYFKSIVFIRAKCPNLNIKFSISSCRELQGHFYASNQLVLYNTQLLSKYGKLDRRVKPLVMFLRLWAKSLGFISETLLSSYGFTLLVVFYLQNTHPAVLPSVKYLNELADYSRIIDGWETAICHESEYIKLTDENSKTGGELLMGFFDFYWEFDFIQNIVSVYEGKPLPVKLVKYSDNERIRTFPETAFSIQDPFILSRNVSRKMTMTTSFKLSLLIAKDLLRQKDFNLKLLLNPSHYQAEINHIFSPSKTYLPLGSVSLILQLTYEIFTKLEMTSELNPWFNKVSLGLLEILQHGLLLECKIVDKGIVDSETIGPPVKKFKSNVLDIGYLKLLSIQCIVHYPTLCENSRNQVLEDLKRTNPSFEVDNSSDDDIPASLRTEYKISKELSKDKIETTMPEIDSHFTFLCHCFQFPESRLSDITISFCPITNHKFFNETKPFLRTFVLQHIKSILQED